jgi:hypothetical protein
VKGPIADKGELLGLRATGIAVAAGTTVGHVVRRVREVVEGAVEQVGLGPSTESAANAAEPSIPPRPAPAKKAVKKVPAKKAPSKKAPAKKVAVKKAAKKAPAKKEAAKKAPSKKAPAKKAAKKGGG